MACLAIEQRAQNLIPQELAMENPDFGTGTISSGQNPPLRESYDFPKGQPKMGHLPR